MVQGTASRHMVLGCLLAIALAATAPWAAGAPFFQGLGDLPGGSFASLVYALSSDGSTVVGQSNTVSGFQGFR